MRLRPHRHNKVRNRKQKLGKNDHEKDNKREEKVVPAEQALCVDRGGKTVGESMRDGAATSPPVGACRKGTHDAEVKRALETLRRPLGHGHITARHRQEVDEGKSGEGRFFLKEWPGPLISNLFVHTYTYYGSYLY